VRAPQAEELGRQAESLEIALGQGRGGFRHVDTQCRWQAESDRSDASPQPLDGRQTAYSAAFADKAVVRGGPALGSGRSSQSDSRYPPGRLIQGADADYAGEA
jgi:hypothetical protein